MMMQYKIRQQRHAGFTLIELLIVITIIGILAAIAIPNLLYSRKAANESAAVDSLRVINSAESGYRSRYPTYGALSDLANANLVDPALGAATSISSTRSNYYFTISGYNQTQYYVIGMPSNPSGGDHQYYMDESGIIYIALLTAATPASDSGGIGPAGFIPAGN